MRGVVPEGWVEVELGEVGNWSSGGTPSKARPDFWGPGIPWVSPKDMKSFRITASEDQITEAALNETSLRLIPEGSVLLVVRSGILVRTLPVGITNAPVTINQDLKAIVPHDGIDPAFLGWFLRSAENSILRNCAKSGTTVSSIKTAALESVRVPLAPVPEQHRIVAKVDELFSELDAGVAALARAQVKLERYRASVLKAAVEGRLTEQWRKENPPEETGEILLKRILAERRRLWEEEQLAAFQAKERMPPKGWREKYKEPEGPDTSGLPELPEGWCWGTVDQIGHVGSGITMGGKNHRDEAPLALPYLRVANVQRGFLDLSEIKEIEVSREKASRYSLKYGDVLFTEGGDRDKLGRGSVWRNEIPGCLHQNHVFRVRLFTPCYSPELLSHQGNSFGQRWFLKYASQTVNLASINQTVLRRFPLPVPPRREQDVLVRKLDEALDRITRLNEALSAQGERTESLRQSILKLAFEGRLVPQDPNDEPASVLLERIRASRKAEKPAAKRPRNRKSRQGSLDL